MILINLVSEIQGFAVPVASAIDTATEQNVKQMIVPRTS